VRAARIRVVPRVVALLGSVVLALAGSSSAAPTVARARAHGLTLPLPSGWRLVDRSLTDCSNPTQRLAIGGDGALVVLQERLGSDAARGMPARPTHFSVTRKASPMECCAVLGRRGWMFPFVDRGRALYAYIYPGHPGSTTTALRLLDRLVVDSG
jgi:hypothetical protein